MRECPLPDLESHPDDSMSHLEYSTHAFVALHQLLVGCGPSFYFSMAECLSPHTFCSTIRSGVAVELGIPPKLRGNDDKSLSDDVHTFCSRFEDTNGALTRLAHDVPIPDNSDIHSVILYVLEMDRALPLHSWSKAFKHRSIFMGYIAGKLGTLIEPETSELRGWFQLASASSRSKAFTSTSERLELQRNDSSTIA